MDIVLIPGLWLDAESWGEVLPALEAAGHTVHALTMPGVGAVAADSSGIGIADWVGAVTDKLDALDGPAVVVGHSGGGNVAWGAADARPEKIARVIFVDSIPPHPGGAISTFDAVDGVIPFPGWDFFDEFDVWDIDELTRDRTASLTQSVPLRVPSDPIPLTNDARFDVPVTLLMGGSDEATFRGMVADWGLYGDEFGAIKNANVVKLGTAHWPQFTQPKRLAGAILDAVAMGPNRRTS